MLTRGTCFKPMPLKFKLCKMSIMDLLLNKGVVDNHSLHKVSHSFPKVVLSDGTSLATKVAVVDNTELAIQVGGHTARVVFLDIGAQLVIIGVQFAKKMGMLNCKLQKSMWQIHIVSGSIKEILGGEFGFYCT